MKIVCLQENLKKALSYTERIIGKNLTLPILNNIFLSSDKGRLKISSTDLEIAINAWTSGKIEEEGGLTIPAKLLTNFVNNLPNKKVFLRQKKNNILNLKCDNYQSDIRGLDAKDYPIIPKIEEENLIKINSDKFKIGLNQVINLVSDSETRPEIGGVYLDFSSLTEKARKSSIKIVATDSFRLGEKSLSKEIIKEFKKGVKNSIIIPAKTIQELVRILDEKTSEVKIILGNSQVLFDLGNVQIISRLIEGEYPNYNQIIPTSFTTEAVLKREEILQSVKIASFFSSKVNDVKFKISPAKNLFQIFSQTPEVGANTSELKGDLKGKDCEISFNYRYLLDGLNNIFSQKVILGLNGPSSPGLLRGADESSYLYIIMPIKSQ